MMMLVAAGLVPKQSLRLIVPPNWEKGFEKREAPCLLGDTGKKAQKLGEEGDDCACVMKGALGNGSRAVIVTRLARSTFLLLRRLSVEPSSHTMLQVFFFLSVSS